MAYTERVLFVLAVICACTAPSVKALVVRTCENDDFFISCCAGSFIDVKWALYGRENGTDICQKNEAVPCGNETASLQKVIEACQGEQQCRFDVTNEYFGGDPCPSVGKYLTVDYNCSAVDACVCQREVYITTCVKGKFTAFLDNKRYLICVSNSSYPATNLAWFKNDTTATSLDDYDMSFLPPEGYDEYVSVSIFTFEVKGKNENVYKCCGTFADNQSNCLGDECASCTLEVIYFELIVSQTPSGPHREGDDVILTCRPDANPETSSGWYEWRHGVDPEDLKSLGKPTYIAGNSILNLPQIDRSQSGWYQCASDDHYETYHWHPHRSESIPVVVHYKASITNKEITRIWANEGSAVILECLVQGNPAPTVTWYGPNNARITDETMPYRTSLDETIIGNEMEGFDITSQVIFHRVEAPTDYGTYRCSVSNGIGTMDEHEILFAGKPESPKSLEISGLTESRFTINWTPGYDGGMTQYFHVNCREISEIFNRSSWAELDSSVHYWSVTGKKAYTLYVVAVYSKNVAGASDYSSITVRTLPNRPEFYDIDVKYSTPQGRIVVKGIPEDGDSETCLRLEGQLGYYDDHAWEVVTGYECIQHDDDFVRYEAYSYVDVQSRYCHSGLCSRPTIASSDYFYPTDKSPTQGGLSVINIVLIAVGATIGLIVALGISAFYARKCLGCTKSSPQDNMTTNSAQPNSCTTNAITSCRTEAINQLYDAPPNYTEALEMKTRTETDADRPPEYESAVAPPTGSQTEEESQL